MHKQGRLKPRSKISDDFEEDCTEDDIKSVEDLDKFDPRGGQR